MPDFILHHYPGSPFAEKARLMLGFKGASWRSVTVPRWMPKPDLMPLTGGYRRTPVAQVGADVFCDTACIAREVERRFPGPALFPDSIRGAAAVLGAWADRTLFFDVVGVVFGTLGPAVPRELREDRLKFSDGVIDLDRYTADQPHLRAQLRAHLFWLEHAMDDGRAHLFGAQPCYADFCVWGPLWMLHNRVPDLALLSDMPFLRSWVARMEAIGHGTPSVLEPRDALEVARAASPALPELGHPEFPAGFEPGSAVTVAADDYGRDPVRGTLVDANAQRLVLRRADPLVGEVNVHFPRAGFRLTAGH
ncbi:MAG: glutathione S-transferase family protein [Betaproteobacteria bacterium]|jgi:glutathione S-transferase